MPWVAPVVAFINAIGYLWCPTCCPDPATCQPLYGDNASVQGETCERCRAGIRVTTTRDFVQVT